MLVARIFDAFDLDRDEVLDAVEFTRLQAALGNTARPYTQHSLRQLCLRLEVKWTLPNDSPSDMGVFDGAGNLRPAEAQQVGMRGANSGTGIVLKPGGALAGLDFGVEASYVRGG